MYEICHWYLNFQYIVSGEPRVPHLSNKTFFFFLEMLCSSFEVKKHLSLSPPTTPASIVPENPSLFRRSEVSCVFTLMGFYLKWRNQLFSQESIENVETYKLGQLVWENACCLILGDSDRSLWTGWKLGVQFLAWQQVTTLMTTLLPIYCVWNTSVHGGTDK